MSLFLASLINHVFVCLCAVLLSVYLLVCFTMFAREPVALAPELGDVPAHLGIVVASKMLKHQERNIYVSIRVINISISVMNISVMNISMY